MFIQYEAANMMSSGVEIKICSVTRNHKQGTQTIMLYANKPDKLWKVSTKFMRDHSQVLIKKEEQAQQVIHKFYLSIKREEWTLDTMRDLYETVTTNYNNTRNKVDWIYDGTDKMDSTMSVMQGYMDQQEGHKTKVAWITKGTDEMDSTVSVMPNYMDQ